MNLNVDRVLMFALVVCVFYYLIGSCGCKEGWDNAENTNWCENKMKRCLCRKTGIFHSPNRVENRSCNDEVDNIMLPEIMRANMSDKCIMYPYQDGNLSWFQCQDLPY